MMILGVVKLLQPVHGYDVRRELLSWNADEWANVAPGSIYHALRKLSEEGLLEEVATEQVGARPARTTYRITPKGDSEFEDLLRDYWWRYEQPVDPFQAAMAFVAALPREEAVGALRNRAQHAGHGAEGLRARDRQRMDVLEAGPRAVDVGAVDPADEGGNPLVSAGGRLDRGRGALPACGDAAARG